MGNSSQDETSTSGREVHLSSLDYDDIMTRMNDMMLALNENQKVVENLKRQDEVNKQTINNLNLECAASRNINQYVIDKNKEFDDLRHAFQSRTDELAKRTKDAESERNVVVEKFKYMDQEKQNLVNKICHLEKKLYARDQTEQTIHLNKPKEFQYFQSKWGIGYSNPQNLEKAVKLVPTLYDMRSFSIGTLYPNLALKWTKMSEEDREKEEKRRSECTKMKLPFCYGQANVDALKALKTQTLSNDYFHSYSTSELEAQPIEGKLYVPSLILESKIVQLEEKLEINQYMFELEKDFLMTIFLNHESESRSKLEDIPESNESILSDSDASSCKAFMGISILKDIPSDDDSNLTVNQKECKESFKSQGRLSDYNNWVEGARKFFANRNESHVVNNDPSISSSNGKAFVVDNTSESDIFEDSLDFQENSFSFDFNATLPDHSGFLFDTEEIPSEFCKGESSKTNAKVVPETSSVNKSKPKRKSRKRNKKKKSLKPTTQSTNFSKPSSSGSHSHFRKGVKQEWRPKLPTSGVGSTVKSVNDGSRNNTINFVKPDRAFNYQK